MRLACYLWLPPGGKGFDGGDVRAAGGIAHRAVAMAASRKVPRKRRTYLTAGAAASSSVLRSLPREEPK